MGLFDKFRKGKAGASSQNPAAGNRQVSAYATPKEEKFWSLYEASLRQKDSGRLKMALWNRGSALDYCINEGYKGIAYHNLAILCMHHLGKGQDAADYARKSLACGEEFRRCSQEHLAEIPFGAHFESLQTAAMTAGSYDEALEYLKQGEELYGGNFATNRKGLESFRKENPRFADYQRQTSLLYYSRVSQELDQGDYAPAMSILQLMLDRAEAPEYDLGYEEYVDILDDYGTITIMYLMKKARAAGMSQQDFAREMVFIADEPLRRIADFMPDCEPGDKQKFINIAGAFSNMPGIRGRDSFEPLEKMLF